MNPTVVLEREPFLEEELVTHGSLFYLIRARCNYKYLTCHYVLTISAQIAIDHRRLCSLSL
jgi:hypothetical protein